MNLYNILNSIMIDQIVSNTTFYFFSCYNELCFKGVKINKY